MIASLFVISVIRGDGTGDLTGIIRCDAVDWFLFFLLLAISFLLTVIALVILKKEEKNKREAGYVFTSEDL